MDRSKDNCKMIVRALRSISRDYPNKTRFSNEEIRNRLSWLDELDEYYSNLEKKMEAALKK